MPTDKFHVGSECLKQFKTAMWQNLKNDKLFKAKAGKALYSTQYTIVSGIEVQLFHTLDFELPQEY